VLAFNALSNSESGTLVTVTIARAGRRRSIVPALAEATVDIRTKAAARWDEVTAAMSEIVALVQRETGTDVTLHTHSHRPGVLWDEETDRLLEVATRIGAELSIEVDAFESAAAGSSAFAGPSTVTLDGMGPMGADLMTHNEHIEIDSLVPRAALLAEIIRSLPTRTDG